MSAFSLSSPKTIAWLRSLRHPQGATIRALMRPKPYTIPAGIFIEDLPAFLFSNLSLQGLNALMDRFPQEDSNPLYYPNLITLLNGVLAHPDRRILGSLIANNHAFDVTIVGVCMRDTRIAHPDLASTYFALCADASIAVEDWNTYAHALTQWARLRNGGIFAWALRSNLPLLNCLPLQEEITALYGGIPDEGTFRLGLLISNTTTLSAHETLSITALLQKAGDTPEEALFAPRADFLATCAALPTITRDPV